MSVWTKALPTKEGWYWIRGVFRDNPYIARVKVCVDNTRVIACGFYSDSYTSIESWNSDYEWYGPLEIPD